jgi:hypothetical protein
LLYSNFFVTVDMELVGLLDLANYLLYFKSLKSMEALRKCYGILSA